MKKYICITNLVFELPENFEGTVTEALEEIVKYRKSDKAKKNRVVLQTAKLCNSLGEALCELLDTNSKLHLEVKMIELDGEGYTIPDIDDDHLN